MRGCGLTAGEGLRISWAGDPESRVRTAGGRTFRKWRERARNVAGKAEEAKVQRALAACPREQPPSCRARSPLAHRAQQRQSWPHPGNHVQRTLNWGPWALSAGAAVTWSWTFLSSTARPSGCRQVHSELLMYPNPLLCCFSGFSFSTVLTKAGEGSLPTSTREAGKAEAGGA